MKKELDGRPFSIDPEEVDRILACMDSSQA